MLKLGFAYRGYIGNAYIRMLCTMPRDRNGALNAGTFACRSFHRDTKASKRAKREQV